MSCHCRCLYISSYVLAFWRINDDDDDDDDDDFSNCTMLPFVVNKDVTYTTNGNKQLEERQAGSQRWPGTSAALLCLRVCIDDCRTECCSRCKLEANQSATGLSRSMKSAETEAHVGNA